MLLRRVHPLRARVLLQPAQVQRVALARRVRRCGDVHELHDGWILKQLLLQLAQRRRQAQQRQPLRCVLLHDGLQRAGVVERSALVVEEHEQHDGEWRSGWMFILSCDAERRCGCAPRLQGHLVRPSGALQQRPKERARCC